MKEKTLDKIISVLLFLTSICLIISSILGINLKYSLDESIERCEVMCELNNEATQSLDVCVGLVNDLGDANISSNFTELNCKTICGG